MGQVTQACYHLDLETIKQKIKLASSYWDRQKWLAIYNAPIDPGTSTQIASHGGVSQGFVREVISNIIALEKLDYPLQAKEVDVIAI